MGGALAKIVFKNGSDDISVEKYKSVNEIPVTLITGEKVESIQKLVEGKKLYMIVNVASK